MAGVVSKLYLNRALLDQKSIMRSTLNVLRRAYCSAKAELSAAQEKLVDVKDQDGVRKIVLNSPKTRNALSMRMMQEIWDAIAEAKHLPLYCLVISAEGPVFSSGHNLRELANGGSKLHYDAFSKCADLMLSIVEAPMPVIACVNGVAAAAGCQLVASCDIVVASSKSSFSTPGANFGIFCSTPGIALSRSVGRKAAARMLLTGLPVSAAEALQMGLVSAVCDERDLEKEVERHVGAIKAKSRAVISLGKKFFYEQLDKDIYSAYKMGAQVMTDNLHLQDGVEGLKSFVEKRKPVWSDSVTPEVLPKPAERK